MLLLLALIVLAVLTAVSAGQCKDSGYGTFVWANHNNVDGYWRYFNWDVITTIGFFGSLDEGTYLYSTSGAALL